MRIEVRRSWLSVYLCVLDIGGGGGDDEGGGGGDVGEGRGQPEEEAGGRGEREKLCQ